MNLQKMIVNEITPMFKDYLPYNSIYITFGSVKIIGSKTRLGIIKGKSESAGIREVSPAIKIG